ncbi:MAG: integral rane protein [Frankiales bacterium]|nr:integral rane protein [Frankiales bacterium]
MPVMSAPPSALDSALSSSSETVVPTRLRVFAGGSGSLRRRLLVSGVSLLLLVAAALSFRIADADSGYDFLDLLRAVGQDAARLRWQFAGVVVVLCCAHYVATAVAARAAAGLPLPLGEAVLVQLAASAANRITPAGLGGSAVTARYLTKRGLPAGAAIGSVIALDVLGAVADLLVVAPLVFFGRWVGLGGGAAEAARLGARVSGMSSLARSAWVWGAVGVVVICLLLARGRIAGSLRRGSANFLSPLGRLMRRPSGLATVLAASGATTLLLALAFAVSVAMVPGPAPQVSSGALVIGFMLGSAASNAIPTPAGIGATETALVGVLLVGGISIAHAVEVVVIFRVITFWIPPLLGLLSSGHLRRRGAL